MINGKEVRMERLLNTKKNTLSTTLKNHALKEENKMDNKEKSELEAFEGLTPEQIREKLLSAEKSDESEFNPDEFIGNEVKIEDISPPISGVNGWYCKVLTERVGDTAIQASRIMGIILRSDGTVQVIGKKAKAFMDKHGVEKLGDLIGKTVKLQTTTSVKDGRDYLSF